MRAVEHGGRRGGDAFGRIGRALRIRVEVRQSIEIYKLPGLFACLKVDSLSHTSASIYHTTLEETTHQLATDQKVMVKDLRETHQHDFPVRLQVIDDKVVQ